MCVCVCVPRLNLFFFTRAFFILLVDQIIDKELVPLEEEIIETKVDHWIVPAWSELETRTLGPTIEAGGHEW